MKRMDICKRSAKTSSGKLLQVWTLAVDFKVLFFAHCNLLLSLCIKFVNKCFFNWADSLQPTVLLVRFLFLLPHLCSIISWGPSCFAVRLRNAFSIVVAGFEKSWTECDLLCGQRDSPAVWFFFESSGEASPLFLSGCLSLFCCYFLLSVFWCYFLCPLPVRHLPFDAQGLQLGQ